MINQNIQIKDRVPIYFSDLSTGPIPRAKQRMEGTKGQRIELVRSMSLSGRTWHGGRISDKATRQMFSSLKSALAIFTPEQTSWGTVHTSNRKQITVEADKFLVFRRFDDFSCSLDGLA